MASREIRLRALRHFGIRCHPPERQSPRWVPWVTRISQRWLCPYSVAGAGLGCGWEQSPNALHCLKTIPSAKLGPHWDILAKCKNFILGSLAGRVAQFLFPGSANNRFSSGPQRGLRYKGSWWRPAHFLSQDNKGGAWQAMFSLTGQITLTGKLFSESLKSQIWSSSQSKHNPFQQPAAQASEIQRDSPPSSHQPDLYAQTFPRGF